MAPLEATIARANNLLSHNTHLTALYKKSVLASLKFQTEKEAELVRLRGLARFLWLHFPLHTPPGPYQPPPSPHVFHSLCFFFFFFFLFFDPQLYASVQS
jgi:hypothetical protein